MATLLNSWRRLLANCVWVLIIGLFCLLPSATLPAWAGINDDYFDGNVFVLYGGNGSLVPPQVTLAESLKRDKPTLLVFYTDDSSDCKQYAIVVSRLQGLYGWATDFIPISVDTIPVKSTYAPTEPGYYYEGFVPQVVLFDRSGKVVFNDKGQVPFERIDDALREVFNLLPRSESVELKRRQINEFSSELAK